MSIMDVPYPLILAIISAGFNVLAFIAFAHDKLKAKANAWRTSENTLLFLALLGPFGALVAMYVFRHKTRHLKFYLVWFFVILQLFFIIWLSPCFSP
jgi:uncharacterized membrane protein YsdA (DUF1294 family)